MIKKITVPLLAAILVSLLVSGAALASDGTIAAASTFGGRLAYGDVSEIAEDGFTVQSRRGGSFTYQINADTHFRSSEIEEPGFDDLQVGQKVLVAARPDSAGILTARVIILLPAGFDPAQKFDVRARGEVTAVDVDANTFSILTPTGEDTTFSVDENTRFLGRAASLEGLQTGWTVGVAASDEGGSLSARILVTAEQPRRARHSGTIISVDAAAGTFVINTRQGAELTFNADANTRFYSRNHLIESLSDLQPDMLTIVSAQPQADGSLLALRVAAVLPEDLPDFEIKTGGHVSAVGTDYFTVQPQSGEAVTFLVSTETKFRGPGGVTALSELEVDMVILAGGSNLETGEHLAKLVIAGNSAAP